MISSRWTDLADYRKWQAEQDAKKGFFDGVGTLLGGLAQVVFGLLAIALVLTLIAAVIVALVAMPARTLMIIFATYAVILFFRDSDKATVEAAREAAREEIRKARYGC